MDQTVSAVCFIQLHYWIYFTVNENINSEEVATNVYISIKHWNKKKIEVILSMWQKQTKATDPNFKVCNKAKIYFLTL